MTTRSLPSAPPRSWISWQALKRAPVRLTHVRKLPLAIRVLDASGKTVLPGFVDSHTHFIFGGYRAEEFSWRLKGDTYMSIMERGGGINATVGPTRDASIQELVSVGRERMNRMLEFGVTTVEGKAATAWTGIRN